MATGGTASGAAATSDGAAWRKAAIILLAFAAVLFLAYGALFIFSKRTVSIDASGPPRGDVALIAARGEEIDVASHLASGKFTVVDFYADWCIECRRLSPYLEELARRHDDFALRKVNIVAWGTPVTQQFEITFLPYLMLYGPDGRLIARGAEPVLAEIEQRFPGAEKAPETGVSRPSASPS
jgi:thiol-disulfide isomerase/thioredoxin